MDLTCFERALIISQLLSSCSNVVGWRSTLSRFFYIWNSSLVYVQINAWPEIASLPVVGLPLKLKPHSCALFMFCSIRSNLWRQLMEEYKPSGTLRLDEFWAWHVNRRIMLNLAPSFTSSRFKEDNLNLRIIVCDTSLWSSQLWLEHLCHSGEMLDFCEVMVWFHSVLDNATWHLFLTWSAPHYHRYHRLDITHRLIPETMY